MESTKRKEGVTSPFRVEEPHLTEVNRKEVRSFKWDKFLTITTRDFHED